MLPGSLSATSSLPITASLQRSPISKSSRGRHATNGTRDPRRARESVLEEAAEDLESGGAVSEVIDEETEGSVDQAWREAEDFGGILVQHYEDAT